MCVASAVSNDWINRNSDWQRMFPIGTAPAIPSHPIWNGPTREEFDALKKEMQELKKLLIAAKQYDEATGQPDCEMEDKVELITKLAKLVGVDMQEVFNNHK
jgi:hypothetical protein